MAELKLASWGSMAGPVQALGRWGILRLLPHWRGEQVMSGGRVRTWSDVEPLPIPLRRTRAAVEAPADALATRDTALSLRRTIHAWRAAERELAAAAIDSLDRSRLQQEVDALRTEHHRLFLEVSLQSRPKAVDSALG